MLSTAASAQTTEAIDALCRLNPTFNLKGKRIMKVIALLRFAMLTAGVSLGVIAPAIGGSIFLKIPNVTGPVTKSGFSGDIELTAYSQGFSNPVSTSTGGG